MTEYFLLFITILLSVIGQLTLKKGATLNEATIVHKIIPINIHILIGLFIYGLSALSWIYVLKKIPLSIAYPMLSVSYIIIIFLSYVFFKEVLSMNKIVGSIAIGIGILLLSRG